MEIENSKKEITSFFFNLRNKFYLYHLSTERYARHVAVATLVDKMDELIDKFLEILYGKYQRLTNLSSEITININKMNDADALFFVDECITFLNMTLPTLIQSTDSDLFNIRDDMVGLLNRTKYLFILY